MTSRNTHNIWWHKCQRSSPWLQPANTHVSKRICGFG